MHNLQTCPVADLHVFTTMVPITKGKTIEITADVIGSPGVGVPIGINLVGSSGCSSSEWWLFLNRFIHTVPAFYRRVVRKPTDLAR
jgi:hypothetical protein